MRLTVLNELFKSENPSGAIIRERSGFRIQFHPGGKGYHYSETTVYGLAERLKLIPDVNMRQVARQVIDALDNGAPSVVASSGVMDTIRCHHDRNDIAESYLERGQDTDEFDRPLARYHIMTAAEQAASDLWACTY